jgi:hypothetical protein
MDHARIAAPPRAENDSARETEPLDRVAGALLAGSDEDIDALRKETKGLVLAALGAVAFIAISTFSIRDCNLLSGSGTVKLPLLDVDVSVFAFFFAAPIFLLLLFVYVHMDMRRAVEGVMMNERLHVWPLSEFPPRRLGDGFLISRVRTSLGRT